MSKELPHRAIDTSGAGFLAVCYCSGKTRGWLCGKAACITFLPTRKKAELSLLLELGQHVPGRFFVWDKRSQSQRDASPMTTAAIPLILESRGSVRSEAEALLVW